MKLALTFALALTTALHAQSMPGMDMSKPMPGMTMSAHSLIESQLNHSSSGTSIEPNSTPMSMLMSSHGGWMLMLHANAFLADTQQTGPRGHDKLYSTNWIMPMAQRTFGRSQLTLRTMLSLEPATISHGYFPELFQQGETANNIPIIDGQHPHNFFMELAALYDFRPTHNTLLSLYAAPVGDPAIGPTAYPHRLSASENPLAALGHHQQDSTHIAFNVLTAGLTYRIARVELSGFHGAEPTEARWHFQPSPNGLALDSYSTRLTISPTQNLTAQYSFAKIKSPEQLFPTENQTRQTASLMYNRPITNGNLSTTFIWGHTATDEDSCLAEALLNFAHKNYLWTRIESATRSNELALTPNQPLPPNFAEKPIGHAQAFSFGYDRDFHIAPHLLAAPGAQYTLYRTPPPLTQFYGAHPNGFVTFIRFRLTSD